ncbi:hypothetical protein [Sutcliffiella halmapala]|uniref:hypothetical protein n=1 Tax=Sutcliffiella halmapala TaxID=79882 RepID=UPI000995D9FB|nr:hypothetical protein [Sutcliffiella halmapala]
MPSKAFNPIIALFLGIIPGAGHLYANKNKKGAFYLISFFLTIFASLFMLVMSRDDLFVAGLIFIAFPIGVISVIDLIFTLITYHKPASISPTPDGLEEQPTAYERERYYTILLSFIPGLGHFQLGLMTRGLNFLLFFFGLGIMVIFISIITTQDGFLVFLGLLPVIWIYNMFDSLQNLSKKQQGEELQDRTILEDFEQVKDDGRKSKSITMVLSMFPGAGHLYLGLQKRGLQLMLFFVLSIYVLDLLRLSLFLFLVPVIWFFSFFDAMQQAAKFPEERKDEPVIAYFIHHQRWIGIGLLSLGIFYLIDSAVIPNLNEYLYTAYNLDFLYWYQRTFQITIVCLLMIIGGIKLIKGSKPKKEREV